jgi:peptidoglycan/LPS O-acetylase OafA/YrhL
MSSADVQDLADTRPSSAFDVYARTRIFAALNGLRFFCILAVLWHHGRGLVGSGVNADGGLAGRGFLGVDMFFILSGFLITTLLLREEARTGAISLRKFYIRRSLRILPLYFFVVFGVHAYYVLLKGETQYLGNLPYYMFFLSNFIVSDTPLLTITWSLAVEEQYYLVWPVVLILTPRRWIMPVLGVLIALNLVIVTGVAGAALGIGTYRTETFVLKLPNATYIPILLGSVIALVLHDRRGFDALHAVFARRAAPFVAVALLFSFLVVAPPDLRGLPNLLIHLLMGGVLVSLVVREDTALHPLLTLGPLRRIGEISFGIYLYHLIAHHGATMVMTKAGLAPGLLPFALYLLLSVAIAELSFRTLEAYFLRRKDRFQS